MAPGAAPAPVRVLLVLLAAATRPAAAWDLWALRCGFSTDCECGFGPDLRGQRERPGGRGVWGQGDPQGRGRAAAEAGGQQVTGSREAARVSRRACPGASLRAGSLSRG